MLDLHNRTAYVALVFVLLHPVLLLFDDATKFRFIDLVFPVHAPHQKLLVAFGTVAMLAVIVVLLTTQKALKKKLPFRTWKNIHLLSYAMALLFIIHGLMLDPQLKDRPVDFFDAEKLVSVACGLMLLAASVVRYRYHLQTRNQR